MGQFHTTNPVLVSLRRNEISTKVRQTQPNSTETVHPVFNYIVACKQNARAQRQADEVLLGLGWCVQCDVQIFLDGFEHAGKRVKIVGWVHGRLVFGRRDIFRADVACRIRRILTIFTNNCRHLCFFSLSRPLNRNYRPANECDK